MFRKAMFALTATAVLAAAALAPTAASAGWKGGWKHHHHHGWGHGGYGYGASYIGYNGYYGGCWVKKWIDTPYGPRLQRIYVCY